MIIDCKINGINRKITTNADRPLSLILGECVDGFRINNSCQGGRCGNCLVLLNDSIVMSCLVPAFKANHCEVTTFEGFSKSIQYDDISKAYSEAKIWPCSICYASKTLLIESILRKLEKDEQIEAALDPMKKSFYAARNAKWWERITEAKIVESLRDFDVNSCRCLEIPELANIVRAALKNRIRSRMDAGKP